MEENLSGKANLKILIASGASPAEIAKATNMPLRDVLFVLKQRAKNSNLMLGDRAGRKERSQRHSKLTKDALNH